MKIGGPLLFSLNRFIIHFTLREPQKSPTAPDLRRWDGCFVLGAVILGNVSEIGVNVVVERGIGHVGERLSASSQCR